MRCYIFYFFSYVVFHQSKRLSFELVIYLLLIWIKYGTKYIENYTALENLSSLTEVVFKEYVFA